MNMAQESVCEGVWMRDSTYVAPKQYIIWKRQGKEEEKSQQLKESSSAQIQPQEKSDAESSPSVLSAGVWGELCSSQNRAIHAEGREERCPFPGAAMPIPVAVREGDGSLEDWLCQGTFPVGTPLRHLVKTLIVLRGFSWSLAAWTGLECAPPRPGWAKPRSILEGLEGGVKRQPQCRKTKLIEFHFDFLFSDAT